MTLQSKMFYKYIKAYIILCRVKTLPAAICPLAIGFGLSIKQASFNWPAALLIIFTALGLQISCNVANDYYDCINQKDTINRLGPTRVGASGLLSIAHIKRIMYVSFLVTTLLGFLLIFKGGWGILALGTAALLAAFLYTGGPLPYGYLGLGDIFVFIFFGPVAVCATFYLLVGSWDLYSFFISISPGLLSVALLATNNLRDIKEDTSSKKRTLAVILGPVFCKVQITLCICVASSLPIVIFLWSNQFAFTMLTIITLFLAMPYLKIIWNKNEADLNDALVKLSKLLISFTILFLCGLFAT